MNERVRELFQEAIDYADKTHTYTPEEGFNIQVWDKIRYTKFAELMVDEVYDYILNATFDDEPWPERAEVKKHFGVE